MDIFKDLRRMYNDAGVSIYAVKDVHQETDEDLDYTFTVAKTLGATHVTLELPNGSNAHETFKRMGNWALKYKMFTAYHTHQQGSMTALNDAFEISEGNMANVDLGHFMAATNPGGTPLDCRGAPARRRSRRFCGLSRRTSGRCRGRLNSSTKFRRARMR
jgi:hypothetical protein